MLYRPAEDILEKPVKLAQRIMSKYSATLTDFPSFSLFQLQGKYQGVIQKGHGLPSPVIEVFGQSDLFH
jgi:hypothetical protein